MRQIGHLPTESSAARFSDALYTEGIHNEVEPDAGGWAVWVHAEEQVEAARALLARYRESPDDPAFERRSRQARQLREQERQQQAKAASQTIDGRRTFRSGFVHRAGWFTILLIVLSVGITIATHLEDGGALERLLRISGRYGGFLTEVRDGQVWRLITPIFLHGGLLHLLFNMLWLFDLGGTIEGRFGTWPLVRMVLVIGVLSNLGQYAINVPALGFVGGPAFGGMSGVVYGLLAYIWLRGKFDPASGLFLHPQTVLMMLVWFFLCFTPLIPNIANTAHAVGLITGMAWGYLSAVSTTFRR